MKLTTSIALRVAGTALVASSVVGASMLAPLTSGAATSTKTVNVVKILATTKYGKILVSAKGFALYTYSLDKKNHSNCTGACLASWPALTVALGVTPTGTGVTGLGVIVRSNGKRQVTYQGRPLYGFVGDTGRGQVNGQGVSHFFVAKLSTKNATNATTTTVKSGYGY